MFASLMGSANHHLAAQTASSQPFYNLGLEQYTSEGYPLNWYIEAEGSVGAEAGHVTIHSDTTAPHQGNRALRIITESEGPVVLYTPLLPGSGRPELGEQVVNDDNWKQVEHKITSNKCLREDIVFGVLIHGAGTVWVDDLKLVINGTPYIDGTPLELLPSQSDIEDIERLAMRIASLDPNSDSSDLAAFRPLSSASGIVALGENTHGARALFQLKHRLIRYLVQHDGFTMFALEMPATEADKINDYVTGETDDRDATLHALTYPSWQTEEMWELINWMRSYNQTATVPVSFRGFDVNQPRLALKAMQQQANLLADTTAIHFAAAIANALASGDNGLPLTLSLADSLSRYASEEVPALVCYARILNSGLRIDRPDFGGKSRDAYMADEVLNLLRLNKGRVIVWADNTHVTQFGEAMGAYLADEIGEDYIAIGFTFNEGFYSAYGPDNPYQVHPSYPGTHEYTLSMLKSSNFLLDLRDLTSNHSLRSARGFRYIGSRPQEFTQFFPHPLQDHFDILGFTRRTEAATFLIQHRF